jgi:hypothetical protein
MKFLALICIALFGLSYIFYQIFWMSLALRALIWPLVILGLVIIVIKEMK